MTNRMIILDTETTGLSPQRGDRIIEIGCLEMIDGKLTGEKFHTYLQPYRFSNPHAFKVHQITDEFLADKPRFNDIYAKFHDYVNNSELIIHNSQFDMGFIINEFSLIGIQNPFVLNKITCTKLMAQQKFGRGGNRLDDLCDKYGISREHREVHGALKDCELLAQVYLRMIE